MDYKQRTLEASKVQYDIIIFSGLCWGSLDCSASGIFADAHMDKFYAIVRKETAAVPNIAYTGDFVILGRYLELHVGT